MPMLCKRVALLLENLKYKPIQMLGDNRHGGKSSQGGIFKLCQRRGNLWDFDILCAVIISSVRSSKILQAYRHTYVPPCRTTTLTLLVRVQPHV